MGTRRPVHWAINVIAPWRCGTGPFGRPFWYPVHDQATSVLGSETRLWRVKSKLPRGNAAANQLMPEGKETVASRFAGAGEMIVGRVWVSKIAARVRARPTVL